MSEEIKESTDGTLEQGDFKMKKKPGRPRKLNKDKETVKVDMSKKEEVKKEEPTKLVIEEKEEPVVEETKEVVNEEVKEEVKEEESTPVIQEITDEEKLNAFIIIGPILGVIILLCGIRYCMKKK